MFLDEILVQKKSGELQEYSAEKLLKAVNESTARARGEFNAKLSDDEASRFLSLVEQQLVQRSNNVVKTEYIHALVEKYLPEIAPDVAKTYMNYHSWRMDQAKTMARIFGHCTIANSDANDDDAMTQKNQNANADSSLASTIRCFFADYTGEAYYNEFFLSKKVRQSLEDGYIHIHDLSGRSVYPLNCCLFRMEYVLEHGCEMNGIRYNKPTSLTKCFHVMGDLILMCASQQYGGFTVPRIDSILAPYAEMSYNQYYEKYIGLGLSKEIAEKQSYEDVTRDMYDGFQGLEIKLNTVASSRGDFPFTTISFGLDTSRFGRLASIAALDTRAGGQGEKGKKKPVLFPKLVFLYNENLHGPGKELSDVFEAGIRCSAKAMYPDWLSLTGEGYICSMYKKYGTKGVISPMGCRAFLSPYYETGGFEPADDNDVPVYEGRFNIGVVSLNLPMIYAKAMKEDADFYTVLDRYLEIIRQIHLRTKEYLSHMRAARNPVGFCYGGFYGGNLKPEDEIAPVLESATASFGITALNELQELYNKKSLVEDGQFALEVMQYINDKIAQFKKEDHVLYAIYGTPAESLCGKQVKKFRALYGVIKNVSDRPYVSNSFHCHVTENISPIQKQDLEKRFWELFNGGKIQYCRYHLGYNTDAIRTLIRRAMEMGFYEGVNLSMDYCDDCGYQQVEMGMKCPRCESVHITQIDRMNGYLGFSRVGRDARVLKDEQGNEIVSIRTRYAPHKQAEINERVSM